MWEEDAFLRARPGYTRETMQEADRLFVVSSIVIDSEYRAAEARRQHDLATALAKVILGG